MYNWCDWQFTRDADEPLPPNWQTKWWIDRRHTELIYDLAMSGKFTKILEVGCHNGSSTSALVQASNDRGDLDLYLCDIYNNDVLQRVINAANKRPTLYFTDSLRILSKQNWDLIILDGDHTISQVSRELGLILYNESPTIIAHDIEYRGHADIAGAVLLGDILRIHPAYYHLIDNAYRENEWTHRGLLFATRIEDVYNIAKPLWTKMIEKGE